MRTTHVAQCALEFWRAAGERTKPRLLELVEHYAKTNGELEYIDHHKQSALESVKPWELGK